MKRTLETLSVSQQVHIDNLEVAVQIIAQIGTLYNGLESNNQKELLRQVVHRVVVNDVGNVSLELRTPFAYLYDLSDEARRVRMQGEGIYREKKNDRPMSAASSRKCSNHMISGVPGGIRTPDPLFRRQVLYPLSYRHTVYSIE